MERRDVNGAQLLNYARSRPQNPASGPRPCGVNHGVFARKPRDINLLGHAKHARGRSAADVDKYLVRLREGCGSLSVWWRFSVYYLFTSLTVFVHIC
jgi:hypothetical protein